MQIFCDFFCDFFFANNKHFSFLLLELDEFLSSDVKNDGPALDAMFLCLHGYGMAGHIDRDAELRCCCRWWRSRTATGFIGHQIRM